MLAFDPTKKEDAQNISKLTFIMEDIEVIDNVDACNYISNQNSSKNWDFTRGGQYNFL